MGSAIRIYRKWHPWQGTSGNTNNTTTKWQKVGLNLLQYKYDDMRYGDLRYGHMRYGDLHLTQCIYLALRQTVTSCVTDGVAQCTTVEAHYR